MYDLSLSHSINYHCKNIHSFNHQTRTELLLLCAGELAVDKMWGLVARCL